MFVHAPVVLIPLTALFAVVSAVLPTVRRSAGWALAISAAITLAFTQAAIVSGYEFDELVAGAVNTDEHERLALTTRNFLVVFVLGAVALAALERWEQHISDRWLPGVPWVLVAVTTASAVLATVWAVRTGEEGARLVWDGVLLLRLG